MAAEKFASTQIRASVPEAAVKVGAGSRADSWGEVEKTAKEGGVSCELLGKWKEQ